MQKEYKYLDEQGRRFTFQCNSVTLEGAWEHAADTNTYTSK